jgi:predicted 3-demethylubiquinone-9 3-methyltransferase (glyoxalase superfamily)
MQKITPFLWFNDNAEEAMAFYASVFGDSKVLSITHLKGTPGPANSLVASFELFGQEFQVINGGPNPMMQTVGPVSFTVSCETQEEVDRYWDGLMQGGKPLACGWITDKYGITWQIVPTMLPKLLSDSDPEKVARVTKAFMSMYKFDIAALQRAYDGVEGAAS